MSNLGAYFEVPVTDLKRAMDFYSAVFGCDFVKDSIHGNEMAFFPFDPLASGITGALVQGEIYRPSQEGLLIYLLSTDIEETLRKVVNFGGRVLFPKTMAGEFGYVAEFEDQEGNRIGLCQR